jgi:hypothetical protein
MLEPLLIDSGYWMLGSGYLGTAAWAGTWAAEYRVQGSWVPGHCVQGCGSVC